MPQLSDAIKGTLTEVTPGSLKAEQRYLEIIFEAKFASDTVFPII